MKRKKIIVVGALIVFNVIIAAFNMWLSMNKNAEAQACGQFTIVSCSGSTTCNPTCSGTLGTPIVSNDYHTGTGLKRTALCWQ